MRCSAAVVCLAVVGAAMTTASVEAVGAEEVRLVSLATRDDARRPVAAHAG